MEAELMLSVWMRHDKHSDGVGPGTPQPVG